MPGSVSGPFNRTIDKIRSFSGWTSAALLSLVLCSGCATYNYAERVKVVGFSDDLQKGRSVGNIRGEDCTWKILGYQMGAAPTVDRAFRHAQNQTDGSSLSGSMNNSQRSNSRIRYAVNVATASDGFDAVLFGKNCIVVTGVGYR